MTPPGTHRLNLPLGSWCFRQIQHGGEAWRPWLWLVAVVGHLKGDWHGVDVFNTTYQVHLHLHLHRLLYLFH